ncbi:MAG: gluconate 2-dehydrogenase subunit 3 family protein, partial [Opitutales bacterium]|nr:gluconate 2-dehydrogenase subunit 3 family protein [Opitutales bacterium]
RKFNNLSRGQYGVVEAISDRILPKTDTPGALDVGVPEWIDLMYGEFLTDEEKTVFSKGITGLNRTSRKAHKSIFAKLTGDQQDEVLMGLDESDSTFFKKARELTITGYFTSEKVMKEVLNYDFIPGMWEGCVPISEVGNKVWAH